MHTKTQCSCVDGYHMLQVGVHKTTKWDADSCIFAPLKGFSRLLPSFSFARCIQSRLSLFPRCGLLIHNLKQDPRTLMYVSFHILHACFSGELPRMEYLAGLFNDAPALIGQKYEWGIQFYYITVSQIILSKQFYQSTWTHIWKKLAHCLRVRRILFHLSQIKQQQNITWTYVNISQSHFLACGLLMMHLSSLSFMSACLVTTRLQSYVESSLKVF